MRKTAKYTYQYLSNGDIYLLKNGKVKKVIKGKNAWDNRKTKKLELITQSQIDWLKELYAVNGDRLNDKAILNYCRSGAQYLIDELTNYGKPVTVRGKASYKTYLYRATSSR